MGCPVLCATLGGGTVGFCWFCWLPAGVGVCGDSFSSLGAGYGGSDSCLTGLGVPETPRDARSASVGSIGLVARSPSSGAQASSSVCRHGVPALGFVRTGVPTAGVPITSSNCPSSSSFFWRLALGPSASISEDSRAIWLSTSSCSSI